MQSIVQLVDPDKMPVEITIRMTLEGWKNLREQLAQSTLARSYPAWDLRDQIDRLTRDLEKHLSIESRPPESQR